MNAVSDRKFSLNQNQEVMESIEAGTCAVTGWLLSV